jgi:hypothetical protein
VRIFILLVSYISDVIDRRMFVSADGTLTLGNTQRKAKKYTAAGLEIVDEDGRYYIKKKE